MRRRIVRLGLAIPLALAVRLARADASVSVVHGEGAEHCPDAAALTRLAAESAPARDDERAAHADSSRATPPPTHVYHVSFDRSGAGYRAEIVDETSNRTRTLLDSGADCRPVGHAAAIVLATMWGSEALTAAPPVPPTPPPQPPAPERPPEPTLPPPPPPLSTRWLFGAGGGLAEGIVRPAAPVIIGYGTFELGPAALSLGALWIPTQRLDLAPGAVNVQLVAGEARLCAFAWTRTQLGGCGAFLAGALSAEGAGYSIVTQATRPWLAVGAQLFVDGPLPFPLLRYRGAVEAIVPVHAEAFSVNGVGVAYDTPAFGGLLTLSVEVRTRE